MKVPLVARFAKKHLDIGLSSIRGDHLERLKTARNIALERRKVVAQVGLAGIAGGAHIELLTWRSLCRAGLALAIMAGFSFWHADRYIAQTAYVDSAILMDELPMEVLTDKGFDQWLKSSVGQ